MSDIKTLAMYLGCKCRCDRTPTLESIIISVNTNGYAKVHHSNGVSDRFYFSEIKPILRPLEAMTELQARELIALENKEVPEQIIHITNHEILFTVKSVNHKFTVRFDSLYPSRLVWLLQHGFDLGLLEKDSYILETPKPESE